MKKITTPTGAFGPFITVEVLDDRYRCNGELDLPFIVVGEGVVEDVQPGDFPVPTPPMPTVPASVSPRQIRQALNRIAYGGGTLRQAVEAAVAGGDQDLRDWWEFATEFERSNEHVAEMGLALGQSDEQLDDLWRLAVTL